MKKPNKKIILSVVALILVLMTTIGFTYAWIDDIKLVEFQNDNLVKNGAPLKTGVDINSDVSITKSQSTIQLGNILDQSTDLTYMYQPTDPVTKEQLSERPHAKYEGAGSGKVPQWDDDGDQLGINSKKGYFYESGGMHLSPCYSDGETFYFERKGDSGYREGNKDDENVNYISFTAKVSSPDANVDFWFEQLPAIQGKDKDGKNVDVSDQARYAITVDGECHVYSPTGEALTCNSGLTDTTGVIGTRKTSVYTYGNAENTTEARGQNSNTLFSIKRGSTVYLTVKIWLEDGGDISSVVTSDINLNLVSSWAYTRDITIVDYTSSCKYISSSESSTSSSWLGNEPMYLVIPSVLEEMCKELYTSPTVDKWKDIRGNDGYGDAPFYDLRNASVTTTGTTEGCTSFTVKNVPLVYNNEQMMVFREKNGWYTGNYTTSKDNYEVLCYNWWSTYLPNTYTNDVYRIYGGSHDNFASRYFKQNVDNKCETYQGYGTWGNLIKIQVDGKTKARRWSDAIAQEGESEPDLAEKNNNNDSIDLYVCDYSDKNTTGEVYIHGMSYEQSQGCWFAYVPESSTLLQFYYDNNNYGDVHKKGWWAYNSWSGLNPQQRPITSTKYYFNHRVIHGSSDNPDYDGIGYWEGANEVYLLKNGNISGADTVGVYMYHNDGKDISEDYDKKESNMEHNGRLDPRDNETPVYNVSTINNGNSGYYPYIKFKGIWNNGNPAYSRGLPLCPGCYFDWKNDRWLGSLTGSGRSAAVDDDPGEGGQESGGGGENTGTATDITNTEPTTDGLYAYGKLEESDTTYTQYAKFSSNSTDGNIVMYLEQGKEYQFMLRKGKKNSWTQYGTNKPNDGPNLSSTGNSPDWTMSEGNDNGQKIKLNVLTTGYYTISIKSSDSGSYTLKFVYN